MIVAVRRALAGLALGLVVGFGAETTFAYAASPSPTASATGKASATTSASPISEVNGDTSVDDSPDVAPDNTNQVIALGAAGALALVAALVVFARRA